MPRFYIRPEVMKKLVEISGNNLDHPIIDRFCQGMARAQLKAECWDTFWFICLVIGVLVLILGLIFLGHRLVSGTWG